MPLFQNILFPVDFSERCRGAAHYAVALAGRFGGRLTLLHVVETPIARPGELDFGALAFETDLESRVEHCRQMLESFLGPQENYVDIERRVEQGDPARTIVRYAHDHAVDLIMMPTHGYGVFRRFILGSVTAKVLHDAECAVWTGVHMEAAPPLEKIAVKHVLCAIDMSPANEKPLRLASKLADEYGAELVVVHAVPSGEAMPQRYMDNELRHALETEQHDVISKRLAELGITVKHVCVQGGDVARVVRLSAQEHQSDLLVIGRNSHTGLAGRLRTHSYAIIRESPCPVISV